MVCSTGDGGGDGATGGDGGTFCPKCGEPLGNLPRDKRKIIIKNNVSWSWTLQNCLWKRESIFLNRRFYEIISTVTCSLQGDTQVIHTEISIVRTLEC